MQPLAQELKRAPLRVKLLQLIDEVTAFARIEAEALRSHVPNLLNVRNDFSHTSQGQLRRGPERTRTARHVAEPLFKAICLWKFLPLPVEQRRKLMQELLERIKSDLEDRSAS
jgi:hypothetical protein